MTAPRKLFMRNESAIQSYMKLKLIKYEILHNSEI
jgi:hypothetical protein